MAIQLTIIDADNDLIADGPATINQNFQSIETHINAIEDVLQTDSSTLKLTNKATIPNNSIESDSITLVIAAGNALVVSPDGGSSVASISAEGQITVRNVIATGVDAETSSFGDAIFTGDITAEGGVAIDGLLDLSQENSRVARKYRTLSVTDANIGTSATSPVDVTNDDILYLDYYNSGGALGGDADVRLDTSGLADGQILKIICLRTNTGGVQRLNNGAVGTEIFAYIDPNGSGFTTVSSATKPAFAPNASPDNQSWMLAQWTDIGGGNYRLVVLDSVNVSGIS